MLKTNYELLYILSVKDTTEEKLNTHQDKVTEAIKKLEGKVTNSENWGKKELAYPINKETKGHYILLNFDILRKNLKELEDSLKTDDGILRFLVTKTENILKKKVKKSTVSKAIEEVDEKEKDKTKLVIARAKQKMAESKREKTAKEKESKTEKTQKTKISLEELDKKIDKVLEEELL